MYMGIYGEENPRSSSTSRVASVYRWRWLPKAVESVLALMSCRRSVVQPEGVAGGVLDGEDAGGILDEGGVGGGAMALTRSWEMDRDLIRGVGENTHGQFGDVARCGLEHGFGVCRPASAQKNFTAKKICAPTRQRPKPAHVRVRVNLLRTSSVSVSVI